MCRTLLTGIGEFQVEIVEYSLVAVDEFNNWVNEDGFL